MDTGCGALAGQTWRLCAISFADDRKDDSNVKLYVHMYVRMYVSLTQWFMRVRRIIID
jgi:hypothetical protein